MIIPNPKAFLKAMIIPNPKAFLKANEFNHKRRILKNKKRVKIANNKVNY